MTTQSTVPVVPVAAGIQPRRADRILHDRVRGEQGEPVVLAPGGDGGHGKARNAARRMLAVGSFPADRVGHGKM
jgi:hypothetical protein